MKAKALPSKEFLETLDRVKKKEEEHVEEQKELAVRIASTNVDKVSWKADRRMTAYPLFAPDKRNRNDIFEYTSPDGKYKITVLPHPKLGRAKVWDADVFTYFLSRAYEGYQVTKHVPHKIETTSYQVLKSLGKEPKSGKNNEWLRNAIRRLGATYYQANIFDGVRGGEKGFHLLDYHFEEETINGKKIIGKIVIQFNSELVDCWINDIKHILSLPNRVLEECLKEQKSGLRKRLLLLIGTRLGNQDSICFSLENFKGLCGYTGENRRFKEAIKNIIPTLPWKIEFTKSARAKSENVLIYQ